MTSSAILKRLIAAYPQRDISESTALVYIANLDDVPIRVLDWSVNVLIRTHKWFPTVQELRTTCIEIMLGYTEETSFRDFMSAREEVLRDPFIRAVAEIAGWDTLHQATSEKAVLTWGKAYQYVINQINTGDLNANIRQYCGTAQLDGTGTGGNRPALPTRGGTDVRRTD